MSMDKVPSTLTKEECNRMTKEFNEREALKQEELELEQEN